MDRRSRLRSLQKAMQGELSCIDLGDGSRHWVSPERTYRELFQHLSDSLHAVADGEKRPPPPEILRVVASAWDRGRALRAVFPEGIPPWLPLDVQALVENGELVSRPLVAGRDADEPVEDLSE